MKIQSVFHFVAALLTLTLVCALGSPLSLAQSVSHVSQHSKTICPFSDSYFGLPLSDKNTVISPLGVQVVASMMFAGADGQTAAELRQCFAFDENPSVAARLLMKGVSRQKDSVDITDAKRFRMANGMWLEQNFSAEAAFRTLLENELDTAVFPFSHTDSSTLSRMNQWIRTQSNGQIKTLIESLDEKMKLLFVNTVFFAGEWASPFDLAQTTEETFTNLDNTQSVMPMMHKQERILYTEDEDCMSIELPYTEDNLALMLILPKKAEQWREFRKTLTPQKIHSLADASVLENVTCVLPKFEIRATCNLKSVFNHLGVETPFDAQTASFKNIDTHETLYVSEALQKICLEIDESGTKGSAVSAVAFAPKALIPNTVERKTFAATRPFWFAVRNTETGTILFFGQYTNSPIYAPSMTVK